MWTISALNTSSELCLFEAFGEAWRQPDGALDTGYYPVRVNEVFASKQWQEVDREVFRQNWSIIVDLNPAWFVYYTPMVFLSAVEESRVPQYMHDSGWIALFVPGSMFDGAFSENGKSKLNCAQSNCLISVASLLDAVKYPTDEVRVLGGFEVLLRRFIGGA
ncbi:MAG: hypothetical protein IT206_09665 [Fimbriimonadaceae bacterium]|nr:hypothetical protein [Fimbriimonadaceae bacterium]